MKYIIEDKRRERNYHVRMEGLNFQLPLDGEGKAYFEFSDDQVTIQGLTVFPQNFSNWDAIRWGIKGLLGLPRTSLQFRMLSMKGRR